MSRTVQGITVTGGASTANNVTYNNDASGLNAENAQDAIDELQSSKIDKASILQESGDAEDKVMSQKAVSDKLSDLIASGLSFKGIATPDTVPENRKNCFYVATTKGTYDNFNGFVLYNENRIVFLCFDNNGNFSHEETSNDFLRADDVYRNFYNYMMGTGGICFPVYGCYFNNGFHYLGDYANWRIYIIPLHKNEIIHVEGLSSNTNQHNFFVLPNLECLLHRDQQSSIIYSEFASSRITEYTAKEDCFCICNVDSVFYTGDSFSCKIKTYGNFSSEPSSDWVEIKLSRDILFSSDLLQKLGNSTTKTMSQKAINDAINNTINNTINNIIKKGFEGEKVVGIGDSLSQAGLYEQDFCQISGATYNGIFSKGGTTTLSPIFKDGTMDRVNQFLESGNDASIIFLENVNDSWLAVGEWDDSKNDFPIKGSIADDSFMISSYYDYDKVYYNNNLAYQEFINNIQTIVATVPSEQKRHGLILRQKVKTVEFLFKVTKAASKAGTIVITIGNNSKSVTVSESDSLETIAYNINQYSFEGFTHYLDNKDKTIVHIQMYDNDTVPTNAGVTVGDTGVEINVSSTESLGYNVWCFTGYTESDMLTTSNWNSPNLYQMYKGIIEKLQSERPTVRIVWIMPTIWTVKYNPKDSKDTNSDGSFNMYKVLEDLDYKRRWKLFEIQKEVCEYYGIEYVEIYKKAGITPYNIETYYNSGDIHPKRLTYTKWANIIYRTLK